MQPHALTTFPYRKNPEGIFFPIIPIRLHLNKKSTDATALVDSGATISVFRIDLVQSLNIKIQNGQEIFLGGVGGRIKGYIHHLKLETAGKSFICPIVFSYEYFASFNLLGRDVFFNKFTIKFEEKHQLLRLE